MSRKQDESDWISVAEAVQESGYHEESIRRLIRDNKLVARKFVTVWQVSRKSLEEYVQQAKLLGNHRGPKEGLDKPH